MNNLTIESKNNKTSNIDKVSTIEMMKLINKEDKLVPLAIENELYNIAEVADEIVNKKFILKWRVEYENRL